MVLGRRAVTSLEFRTVTTYKIVLVRIKVTKSIRLTTSAFGSSIKWFWDRCKQQVTDFLDRIMSTSKENKIVMCWSQKQSTRGGREGLS